MQDTGATAKYTKLADSGRWIQLARLWLNDNVPCTREKLFVELGMLMPSTVRRSQTICKSHQLVRDSYRRLYGTVQIPDIIEMKPSVKKPQGNGTSRRIVEALRQGRTICKDDFCDTKYFITLLRRSARKHGLVIEQVGKGKYRLKTVDAT